MPNFIEVDGILINIDQITMIRPHGQTSVSIYFVHDSVAKILPISYSEIFNEIEQLLSKRR